MALTERDYKHIEKQPKARRCQICGSPEGYGPNGERVRMIRLEGDKWACNYCNNQAPGR
jgi:hypothetical protein